MTQRDNQSDHAADVRTARKTARRREMTSGSNQPGHDRSKGVLLGRQGLTARQIADRTELPPHRVLKSLYDMQVNGTIYAVNGLFYYEKNPICRKIHAHHYLVTARPYTMYEYLRIFSEQPPVGTKTSIYE
jgi:hypothetical protein